jgi:hypothetical protein
MSEINIAGSIKELMIFDDPEYCENDPYSGSYRKCERLDDRHSLCVLFLEIESEQYGTVVETDDNLIYKKCQQCKDVYQKVIERQADDYFDKQPVKTRKL